MDIEKEIIAIKERLTALEKAVSPSVDEVAEEVSRKIKELAKKKKVNKIKENKKCR